jgi:hypothetical protein
VADLLGGRGRGVGFDDDPEMTDEVEFVRVRRA